MSTPTQMAFSMIYKVIVGDAEARIRGIAQVMGEPIAASVAMGDAAEASSARQVSAFERMRDALKDVSDKIAEPTKRVVEFGRAAGEASEKFAKSFAGIGAIAAEGFAAKDVAQQEEYFRRLQINTGMAKEAVEELREAIAKAGQQYGVSRDQMLESFAAYRALGGDPKTFAEQAGNIAATQQATGMSPENTGLQFEALARMGITEPKAALDVVATMNEQLGRVPDRMDAAAEASNRLVASMQQLHMSGAQGALALNAVYAVAARSMGGNARAARTATDSWLTSLADRGYQNQLAQGLGERITDANGFVMDPRIIMQKMAQKYADVGKLPSNQQAVAYQRLNNLFGDDAAHMFRSVGGEIQSTGHSATLDAVLGAKGDSTDFLKRASDASQTLTGSLNRLRNAMERVAEDVLTGPINTLTSALNHFNGVVANVVIMAASLVAVGTALNWMTNAAKGFRSLWNVMSGFGGVVKAVIVRVFGLAEAEAAATVATEELAVASSGGFLASLIAGFAGAATAAWGFTAAVLANPVTWVVVGIVAALAAVSFGLYELWKHWGEIWKAMPAPVKTVLDFVSNTFMAVSKALGYDWKALADVVVGVMSVAKTAAVATFDWIYDKVGWIWDKLGVAADWVARMTGISSPARAAEAEQPAGEQSGAGEGAGGGGGALTGAAKAPANASFIQQVLEAHGFSDAQAQGISAGIAAEGGSLGMARNGAFGIGQWRGDRQRKLLGRYGNAPTLTQQMEFLVDELHGGDPGGAAVTRSGTAMEALNAYIRDFMRPGSGTAGDLRRGMAFLGGNGSIGDIPVGMAANDAPHVIGAMTHVVTGSGSIYGAGTASRLKADAPAPIFGAGGGSGEIASASPWGDAASGGDSTARAMLTIRMIDPTNRTKTHIEHTSGMEAHIDRGTTSLSWG